jgi:cysteine desulfurase/selenocysteine lyase
MAQAVGLAAALEYLSAIGMAEIYAHEQKLGAYLLKRLQEVPQLKLVGPLDMNERGAVASFTLGEIHPHDLGQYLDAQGIAVRTGHHCAWPLTRKLGVQATTRASLYLYNDEEDVDVLIDGILGAQKYFGDK